MKDALLYEMAYHFIDLAADLVGRFNPSINSHSSLSLRAHPSESKTGLTLSKVEWVKKIEWLKTDRDSNGVLTNLEGIIITNGGNKILLDLKMFPPYSETFIEARAEIAPTSPDFTRKVSG